MTIETSMLSFAGIVFAAYTLQTAVGFGAMLVCLTLAAHQLDVREIIVLALPLSMLQSGVVAWRGRAAIDVRFLLGRILPFMGLGLVVGYLASREVHDTMLRTAFAGLVIVLASRELWVLLRRQSEHSPPSRLASIAALLGAGVTHGLYAVGGPLLVYALGRENLDKQAFRATVSAIWIGLNTLLISGFVIEGLYTPARLQDLAILLAVLPFAFLLGDLLHRRIPERPFRVIVFALLIVAATSLLLR